MILSGCFTSLNICFGMWYICRRNFFSNVAAINILLIGYSGSVIGKEMFLSQTMSGSVKESVGKIVIEIFRWEVFFFKNTPVFCKLQK